ncbi:hypothetical protein ANCDUO_04634 [Ancylostoma duodenale]|uniref:G-protein coupled receptors family 1 profile domain-containing protein n=1 Tax=Ancylostoma duodenale TaxID=51022 RepID=A0A0C2DQQ7_9BILA|nr:hypothetical protein ANCDUO_04634 [Ancylostoma duodenale]
MYIVTLTELHSAFRCRHMRERGGADDDLPCGAVEQGRARQHAHLRDRAVVRRLRRLPQPAVHRHRPDPWFWMFGTVPCKLHAVFENFGKILSALILTAMSFDRYAGVCHPQKKFLRSRKLAITILIGLAAYALITLCPLLWSFTSREIIMFARETGYRKITRMKIEKCTVDIDSQMFTAFTIYQFVLCYCTPLILIAYFYSKLLRKLREHARTFKVRAATSVKYKLSQNLKERVSRLLVSVWSSQAFL